jgi:SAM-dependent methyltransferase
VSDLGRVAEHFERLLREHGPTSRGTDYRDDGSQLRRFRRADDLVRNVESVCDLGCGYGAYVDHLRSIGFDGEYIGVDVTPTMVDAARALHPEIDVRVGSDPVPAAVVVAFGTFNVRGADDEEWSQYVRRSLTAMWDAADVGIAFDVLTKAVSPHVFAVDEDVVLAWLAPFGGQVETVHDVGLGELGVIVRR